MTTRSTPAARSSRLLLGLSAAAGLALAGCSMHDRSLEPLEEPALQESGDVSSSSASAPAPSPTDRGDGDGAAASTPAPSQDPAPVGGAGEVREAEEAVAAVELAVAEDTIADMDAGVVGGLLATEAMPSAPAKRKAQRELQTRSAPVTATGASSAGRSLRDAAAGPVAARGRAERKVMPAAEPVPAEVPVTTYGTSERYTDHGVNPFTMVSQDAQSTFSIDVDTASFTVARKKLDGGALPPPEAVRVEEFVNWLDYGYRAPSSRSDSPFAVHMDAMPDPFREGRHILRVGVQGKEVSRDERPPLHLTFLVDVSGSMSAADKLPLAQESLHMLVDSLREDDTVALATYAGRTAKILDPTPASDKRTIHAAISALESGGSTAMSSGLDLAYGMAWDSFEAGHENRVIVLSDGDANVGRTSWDDMLTQIKGYADKGVTMSTIGLGMGNYQDTLMEQLSNKGDGNNYYIDDRDAAQRVFVEELGGTMLTIARDVKIQVEFNEDAVSAYRLIGYENRDIADKDFRNDKVDAGEVGAGHDVTALYEVILKDGYVRDLATVRLRWEQPGADVDHGGSGATERAFSFRDRALSERADLADRSLRMAYTTATFAEILRHSPDAQELSLDALIAFGEKSARPGEEDDQEVLRLMKRAKQLGAGTSSGAVSSR